MTDPTREQEDQDRVQCETFNPPMREDGKAPWEQEDQGTPRTEEVKFLALGVNRAHLQEVVQIDFARQLERDLNASRSAGRREGLDMAFRAIDALPDYKGDSEGNCYVHGVEDALTAVHALASAQPQAERRKGQHKVWTVTHDTGPNAGCSYASFADRRQPRAKAAEQEHGTGATSPEADKPSVPVSAAAPAEWVRVPREPTDDMLINGMENSCLGRPSVDDDAYVRSIWNAMLAALPSLPAGQGERG